MKKKGFFVVMAAAVMFLCACSREQDPAEAEEHTDSADSSGGEEYAEYLQFPDSAWGMTLEEVLDAYGITRDDTDLLEEGDTGSAFAVSGREVFGEEASRILFQFIDPEKGNGEPKLCAAEISYPDDADMENVLKEMEKAYGDTLPDVRIFSMFDSLDSGGIPQNDYIEAEDLKLWGSCTVGEAVPEEQKDDFGELWEELQTGLTADNWESFSNEARLATAVWSAGSEEFQTLEKNGVKFDAYNYIVYEAIMTSVQEQE